MEGSDDNDKAALTKKLQEHLANLDTVEEALKMEPEHKELQKLKADLQELIKLVSRQMLELAKVEKKMLRKRGRRKRTRKSRTQAKKLSNPTSKPRLPFFFYQRWLTPKPQPAPSSCSTPDVKEELVSDKVTSSEEHSKDVNSTEGIQNTGTKKVTLEEKMYYRKRKKFNKWRSKKIKEFLRQNLVDGIINLP